MSKIPGVMNRDFHWAPKVSQSLIRRLYVSEARGILDEELIDEAGYALAARCDSILKVTRAVRGVLDCPSCGREVRHAARAGATIACACGWSIEWRAFQKTYRGRQLFGGAAVNAFEDFHRAFPAARTARERILLIDRFIHEFHWNLTRRSPEPEATRPAAANLIEGKSQADVIAFLDELSFRVSDGALGSVVL
jgi:hypothetical protein